MDAHEIEQLEKLGPHLRRLRLEHGLSQRALARLSGVTNATVSLIEQDHVSPSVASLRKITRALGMSMTEFFAAEEAVSHSPFYPAADQIEVGSEGVSRRLVGAGIPGRTMHMMVERYPSGSSTGPDTRARAGERCGVVLKGRIELTVGEQTRVLGPGDAYYFSCTSPHRLRNVSPRPCELVSVTSA